ncbi:MAG: hypothetical protein LUE29_09685 [Lachnospiraceae bacterium]|nr:hypothetical protein [Lachnospiraceae bacterium]
MLSVEELVWLFIIFICAYAIVSRVCKCIEQCAADKAVREICQYNPNNKLANDVYKKAYETMMKTLLKKGAYYEQKSGNQAGGQTGTERSDGHV